MGYSFRLAARVLLYASHRQDSTYHGLWYTSCGALAGTRNSSSTSRVKFSISEVKNSIVYVLKGSLWTNLQCFGNKRLLLILDNRASNVCLPPLTQVSTAEEISPRGLSEKGQIWIFRFKIVRPSGRLSLNIPLEGRKEMFYLTMHSTHFIYGYMASDIW